MNCESTHLPFVDNWQPDQASAIEIRVLTRQLAVAPATALLSESTTAELYALGGELERWLRLTKYELSLRYPSLFDRDPPLADRPPRRTQSPTPTTA